MGYYIVVHTAEVKAKEKAERDARKNQSKIQKKNGKKSLIIVLSLQNTASSLVKAVMPAEHVEIIAEKEGRSQITSTTGQKIKLPQRFRSQ